MGRLIVIEGVDGAGKRTLADGLVAELEGREASVTRCAFPRYGASVHADLVAETLRGAHGDLGASVHGMAMLYALDRHCAAAELRCLLDTHDVVLLDRYVASNAAYGAARLHQSGDGEFAGWVRALEVERFELPRPHLQILLRVPTELAADRAQHRERVDAGRRRDRFETDSALQQRCAEVYLELARAGWWTPWRVVDGATEVDLAELAEAGLAEPTSE